MSHDKLITSTLKRIEEQGIQFIDLRFTDSRGKEQHVSVPVGVVDEAFFHEGKMFDGSSIAGWRNINNSDMKLQPDLTTVVQDPFFHAPTLNIRCDIIDPSTGRGYERDPRSVAKKAEQYLRDTGIADTCNLGPEPEFFIFDDVRWRIEMNEVSFSVDSKEAAWNSSTKYQDGNLGHRPGVKGGYFPVPPVDSSQNIRSDMAMVLQKMGLQTEAHHHEVATGNQNEISFRYDSLLRTADNIQILKYVVHNVANNYGKTATFMPKPLVGDNGNGMHCHQSLTKDGVNLFVGDQYAGMSQMALYYIGGIIKHAQALNAFTNAATNSYKRLQPGFEAPVNLAYSACNRSAAIRIPYVENEKARRIEVRFPDPCANPYFAFSAMMMAGLDGIQNKIDPGAAMEQDLYELSAKEAASVPRVCDSLQGALDALRADHDFLLAGDVFTEDLLAGYIDLKQKEVDRLNVTTHPVELELYFSE